MVSMTARKRLYFPHVEGLRGLTALYVFLYHLRLGVVGNAAFAGILQATSVFDYGHYAVSVFIVISGYCLGAPVAHRPEVPFDPKAFALRRLRRIYPAYMGALVISLAAFFFWNAARYGHAAPFKNVLVAFGLHVFLLHNLVQKTSQYLNGPMWSVGIETQIYAVFAVVLVPLWKRFGVAVQCVVALVAGVLPHYLVHGALDWTCPWYLGLFALGVTAAAISENRTSMAAWRIGAVALLVAAVAAVFSLHVQENARGYGPFLFTDMLVGLTVAVFFVAAADREGELWSPARLLALKPIAWLGTFAYSIYLLHWVLINIAREILRRTSASYDVSLVAYLALIPFVIAVSYGFYLVLERPFMSGFLRHAVETPAAGSAGATVPVTS